MRSGGLRAVVFVLGLVCTASGQAPDAHRAAEAGDLAALRLLVERDGTLVDVKNADGRTPLHLAARGGHLDVMKFLVERGAGVNVADSYSVRPLFSVVMRNHLQAAHWLVTHGADLAARNSEGLTALHLAAYRGFKDIVSLLVANGAPLDSTDQYGNTPLGIAVQGSSVVQFRQTRGVQDWLDTITVLLDRGALLSREPSRGFRELSQAVAGGSGDLVSLLVARGAEPPTRGEPARDLLHSAARKGFEGITASMMERGADWRTLNPNGGTLLQSASIGGLTRLVGKMASAGMDVNQKDMFGTAPLHGAAAGRHIETVRYLLDHGADINVRTAEGKTALNIAQDSSFPDVVGLLVARGADRSPARFPLLEGDYLGQKVPGSTPEMFAPGIVSREGNVHGAPVFSPDGKEIYWFSWPGPVTRTMRVEGGRWTAPVPAAGVGGNPTISPDGQRMFSYLRTGGIAVSERTASGWSGPTPFNSPVNRMNAGWEIWLTKSGTFYVSSTRAGGLGGKDIYRVPVKLGTYGVPEHLGKAVNSEADDWGEYGGFVDPDERYIIFSSDRSGGFGAHDLYVSFRRNDGTWTQAANLGPQINDAGLQMWPAVSPDGKYLFYCHRSVVYWVDAGIIEKLRSR